MRECHICVSKMHYYSIMVIGVSKLCFLLTVHSKSSNCNSMRIEVLQDFINYAWLPRNLLNEVLFGEISEKKVDIVWQ